MKTHSFSKPRQDYLCDFILVIEVINRSHTNRNHLIESIKSYFLFEDEKEADMNQLTAYKWHIPLNVYENIHIKPNAPKPMQFV